MTENPILFVGGLLALVLAAGLLVWGAFALRAALRRRAEEAELPAAGARRVGAPAFAPLPSEEVPARIPFGTAETAAPAAQTAEAPLVPAPAPLQHAEIVAEDVPRAAVSYRPAMLEPIDEVDEVDEAHAIPAPIEMPVELSVRVDSPARAQPAARPLIDSVPDFSAPPAVAPARIQSAPEHEAAASADAEYVEGADPFDATIISGRRNSAWVFESESGQRVPLSAGVVLLGRNPSHLPGQEDAQLVTVRDAGRTVSKTHVMLSRNGHSWQITDLDSTNGVYLLGPNGEETELDPGTPADITDRFILGEMSARIFQEE